MSGPLQREDGPALDPEGERPTPPTFERHPARSVDLAGTPVRRALPRRGRRTVGAWCFVDHFGPTGGDGGQGAMAIGPHPHIGLQTVTWLLEGEVLHTDSLGSEQVIRPGQLNLMTAGHGVAHAEHTPVGARHLRQHGAQLWVAQPEGTRHGAPAFEHHAELPAVELAAGLTATVLVGELGGTRSPARTDTPLLGVAVHGERGARGPVPLRDDHEHAVVVLAGGAEVDGEPAAPGELLYLGTGRASLDLTVEAGTTLLVLGGEPFPDELLMWWNFVARTRDEVADARAAWQGGDARFGPVASDLDRIDAPEPFWRR